MLLLSIKRKTRLSENQHFTLGKLKASQVRRSLEESLNSETDEAIKTVAAVALGEMGDSASTPVLKKTSSKTNRPVYGWHPHGHWQKMGMLGESSSDSVA